MRLLIKGVSRDYITADIGSIKVGNVINVEEMTEEQYKQFADKAMGKGEDVYEPLKVESPDLGFMEDESMEDGEYGQKT